MRKIYNVIFSFIHIGLIALICFTILNGNVASKIVVSNNTNRDKLVSSEYFQKENVIVNVIEIKQKAKKEIIIVDKKKPIEQKKNIQKEVSEKQESKENTKQDTVIEKVEKHDVLEDFTGRLTAYGSDCNGCSTKTSSGFDISKSIYYQDKDYGKIRILAGDRKYPYGTIVKLKIDAKTEIFGIVLDRGGNIGIDKKFQFDLLFETEKEALKFGSKQNVIFEILRLGY